MKTTAPWPLIEGDVEAAIRQLGSPLVELAAGNVPAIVIRSAVDPTECQSMVDMLIAEELLFDPQLPIPQKFIDQSIPEGYYREGVNSAPKYAWQANTAMSRTRIDVGTSLGYRGSDKEDFLSASEETHQLFRRIFADRLDPVRVIYENLEKLSCGKKVVTAYEPDGRRYGPAIIRAHYGGYTYKPHFDSVKLREIRDNYSVYQFDHQFAGVLVLQNTTLNDKTAQAILHRCLWQPEVDPYIKAGKFHEYAAAHDIENIEVHLMPGDLYFFNTRSIHEVPGLDGLLPRIVLATFIGFSEDRNEIFVWS